MQIVHFNAQEYWVFGSISGYYSASMKIALSFYMRFCVALRTVPLKVTYTVSPSPYLPVYPKTVPPMSLLAVCAECDKPQLKVLIRPGVNA